MIGFETAQATGVIGAGAVSCVERGARKLEVVQEEEIGVRRCCFVYDGG
jgi:hypothetical protein